MNYILFDEPIIRASLLPFTFTRPVAGIRVGILTLKEKWEKYLQYSSFSFLTENYLQVKFPLTSSEDNILINSAVCPNSDVARAITALQSGQALFQGDTIIAARIGAAALTKAQASRSIDYSDKIEYSGPLTVIRQPWDIFINNGQEIRNDFALLSQGRTSAPVGDPHTIVYNTENIFIEEGVKIRAAVLNAEDGPIYIGKNAQIQEGALIRGPFALCEGSWVNMGGKMRGDITVGPFSKVGGEIGNSVIFGYTNKSHEGYLGNSVIGEWCNLGADTNTSNLKNNYANVKLWSYLENCFIDTGKQFCGLMMGDHSKAGINTMFNTGTVVGVGSSIFGAGFPRNFVPSFSWGGPATGFETYRLNKLFDVEEKVMARRNIELDKVYRDILQEIFDQTISLRENLS
jgi:UDP-N-acetylglucosamine diphosphorylase/glucosamine-1-phosphate N-acetyltransferase